MKKLTNLVSVTLAATMLLSACSGTTPSTPNQGSSSSEQASASASASTSSKNISINLIHRYLKANIGINSEDTAVLTMLERFREEHPEVELTEEQLQAAEYNTKVQVLAAANDLPDVFTVPGAWMTNFVNNGLVAPLDEDLAKASNFRNGFRKGVFDAGTRNGKAYGIPVAAGPTHVIFYNSKLFADAGYSTFPETWDDMLKAFHAIKGKGIIPIAMFNKGGSTAQSSWLSVITDRVTGPSWTESICNGSGATFTDPGFVRSLELLRGLADDGLLNKDLNSIDGPMMQSYYFDGKAAAMIDGIWGVTNIINAAPKEILDVTKCAVFPAVPDGKGNPKSSAGGAGVYYSINNSIASGDKRDMCMTMLQYMTGKDCAAIMASVGGFPAYDPGQFDRSKLAPLASEAYDLCNLADATRIFDLWFDTSVIEVMNSGLQEMLAGAKEPKALAAELQKEYQRYLESAPAAQ